MENTEFDIKLKEGLKTFGQDFVLSLATVLRNLDKRASGRLLSSLNYELVTIVKDVNYKLEIEGINYFDVVNLGRPPGKQPPLSKIQQWCSLKGIPKRAAFPIARKIGRFGIDPTNALQEAIKQIDLTKLESELDRIVIESINQQLKEAIS